METVIFLVIFCGLTFGLSVANGWALSILWGWFIVPIFGLPELSIPAAIGIAMIVNYMTYQEPGHADDRTSDDKVKAFIVLCLRPLFAVFIGFIVKLFM